MLWGAGGIQEGSHCPRIPHVVDGSPPRVLPVFLPLLGFRSDVGTGTSSGAGPWRSHHGHLCEPRVCVYNVETVIPTRQS